MRFKYTFFSLFLLLIFCKAQEKPSVDTHLVTKCFEKPQIKVGAENTKAYLPLLVNKKVGVVTNQTGILPNYGDEHLVDFLLAQKINVKKIFSPEHGFRGKADAGEKVKSGIDEKTGLPIISLYGDNRKPKPSQLQDLEVILFDLQDVGVRFYTYISTLHYVMEAAAEKGIPVIVLDRPNPNAHYIDGPMLEPALRSFVGMHEVPIVYGMTIGEYAQMINGEKWLKNGIQADLTVVPLQNYTHDTPYDLPVKPSPNLPNAQSVNLYPSLCFFEGANVSAGRGTDKQFQIYGSPYLKGETFKFVPKPNEGAKNPKFNGKTCYGEDLSHHQKLNEISLKFLLDAYKKNTKNPFFTTMGGSYWIDKLAGTPSLRKQIIAGWDEAKIKKTWQKGLEKFKKTRAKYLLYP
ncbi:exo-beta-N-acetylmuramidase NamZ family protein [Ornithobacterium rhinotracheale]|uniref:exo-beta-N-acetylmuramidase NamZ family protein n=1 Tax=Ornithobacterium rhinotracheale TaxID=28251 RepID=UPI003FA4CBE0